ncbi:putative metal-dependent hydrolase [Deinococcus malanensis]|uniref:Metal-dependent hydrolase n=1 Tax=Deinococcus malanensis TaxID=1706855 RepID=A0ABQ2EX52_9DEIO|nr:DinB family protein [Deinococcus malanensis]GGK25117.1 putative metal-dependent hydrolase [Deinococcus malanensis]
MTDLPDVQPLDPRYPIGPLPQLPDDARVPATLEQMSVKMRAAVGAWQELLSDQSETDLARTYRPGSWTLRQLAHHTADAHLHGLHRLRMGLTIPDYMIQPFDQDAAVALPDYTLPVEDAMTLMEVINTRWVALLQGVDPATLNRQVMHPAEGPHDLWQLINKHDWHLRHHLAQAHLALE